MDLERLIREKQDALRGRPRDWIDDVGDHCRRFDWISALIIASPFVASGLLLLVMLALA
jgi:hypothetical protein